LELSCAKTEVGYPNKISIKKAKAMNLIICHIVQKQNKKILNI